MENPIEVKNKGGRPKKYFTDEEKKIMKRHKQKEFALRHPDKIIQYRENFKHKSKQYNDKYYATKVKGNKIQCECGRTIGLHSKYLHINSKIHHELLNKK